MLILEQCYLGFHPSFLRLKVLHFADRLESFVLESLGFNTLRNLTLGKVHSSDATAARHVALPEAMASRPVGPQG